jgi:hypothetical protein
MNPRLEESGFVARDAVSLGYWFPFPRKEVSSSRVVNKSKKNASIKTLESTNPVTQRHFPEDLNPQIRHCGNRLPVSRTKPEFLSLLLSR